MTNTIIDLILLRSVADIKNLQKYQGNFAKAKELWLLVIIFNIFMYLKCHIQSRNQCEND